MFSRRRDMAGDVIEQAGDGGSGFLAGNVPFHAEQLLHFFDRNAAAKDQAAVGFANGVRGGHTVIFSDFSDDFFQQIFDGDDARDRAMLVHDDCHLLIAPLHFLQQIRTPFGFGNK